MTSPRLAVVAQNLPPARGRKNGGRPPRPPQPPTRDEFWDNISTTGQFPHPKGDLRDHLRARRREALDEDSKRVIE